MKFTLFFTFVGLLLLGSGICVEAQTTTTTSFTRDPTDTSIVGTPSESIDTSTLPSVTLTDTTNTIILPTGSSSSSSAVLVTTTSTTRPIITPTPTPTTSRAPAATTTTTHSGAVALGEGTLKMVLLSVVVGAVSFAAI